MAALEFNSEKVSKRCTLITDASWCPDTKAAGFGGWCAGTMGSGKVGGAIVDLLPSSQVAETVAVCNAIWMSMDKGLLVPNTELLIQIDNLNVIKLFEGKREPSNKHERKAFDWFKQTMYKHELRITFRYIKSHNNEAETKYYCHNLCDKEAKSFMRHRRSQVRLGQMREVHGLGRPKNPNAISERFARLICEEEIRIRGCVYQDSWVDDDYWIESKHVI